MRRRRLINSRNVLLPAEFLASLYQKTCRFYYIWICNTSEMIFGRVLRWYSAITARESTLYCGLSAMRTCRNWIRCTILQEKNAFPEKVRVLYTDLFLLLRTSFDYYLLNWVPISLSEIERTPSRRREDNNLSTGILLNPARATRKRVTRINFGAWWCSCVYVCMCVK